MNYDNYKNNGYSQSEEFDNLKTDEIAGNVNFGQWEVREESDELKSCCDERSDEPWSYR